MNKKSQKQLKDYMKQRGLQPFCSDGGCSFVDVSDKDLQNTLKILSNQQTMRLKIAGLI